MQQKNYYIYFTNVEWSYIFRLIKKQNLLVKPNIRVNICKAIDKHNKINKHDKKVRNFVKFLILKGVFYYSNDIVLNNRSFHAYKFNKERLYNILKNTHIYEVFKMIKCD